MSKIVIAYVPVLHRGYRDFLMRHSDADAIFVLGPELIAEFDEFRKDIRALHSEEVVSALAGWGLEVQIATSVDLKTIPETTLVVMPDEDVSRSLAEKYLPDGSQILYEPVFLRWDRSRVLAEERVIPWQKISVEEFDRVIMGKARVASRGSSDYWRRVGAVAVTRKGEVLTAHNTHLPSPHIPWTYGSPRDSFKRGDNLELTTDMHAEAIIIAEAASSGVSLEEGKLYVTTFPCPPCTKLVAYSGIDQVYYSSGYAVLDGESILKTKGVEIIFVEMSEEDTTGLEYIPYPERNK